MNNIKTPNTAQPLVATIGFFDGVHVGHRFLIERLKQIAREKNKASAVITFPVHPRRVLNDAYIPALLTSFEEKMHRLAELSPDRLIPLDFTHELSQLSAEEFIKHILVDRLHVDCLLIGYDHRFGKGRTESFDDYAAFGKKHGSEVVRADVYELDGIRISSSFIRKLLLCGDIKQANRYLTYNYRLEGLVVHGRQIGKSIGFPTANIRPNDNEKVLPANGVYAVHVEVDGVRRDGMLNIGYAPTVSSDRELTIEAHLFDFGRDIYGKPISIEFIDYIRGEMKFANLDELKSQLAVDMEKVKGN